MFEKKEKYIFFLAKIKNKMKILICNIIRAANLIL